mmetsp:Transcript_1630/g.2884  ORF Transcript_1630/g.2884 Transcript_1630/m.2884 type:complete len:115 (+) Transcript_1630:1-345(+)
MKSLLRVALVALIVNSAAVEEVNGVKISLSDKRVQLAHNTGADDAYLTKVFGKFSVLGLDEQGEPNGRRVLTKFNALNAAREVIGKWKKLSGKELDDYLDSKFDSAWHSIDALN